MPRIQVTLQTKMYNRAKKRAKDLDISLSRYLGRLVERDLRDTQHARVQAIFDLGSSGGSDVARCKHSMVAEAFRRTRP